jgi:hypothetical protein
MASSDLFARLVGFFAEIGHEIATLLTDPNAQADLLARAAQLPASLPPAASPATAETFAALRDRASAGGPIGLELLRDLADGMTSLVALVQTAAAMQSADDAWNLLATWLDLIAIDRMRRTDLELVAFLKAAHLISNDRLLIADMIRARDQWGSFLLGTPPDNDSKADAIALILAAAIAVVGKWVPQEDDKGQPWRTAMLFGWDPDPATPTPRAQRALQRTATIHFTHRHIVVDERVEEHAGFSATVVPPSDGGWGLFLALDVGAGITFPIGEHLQLALTIDSPTALEAFFGDPPFVTAGLEHSNAKVVLRRKAEVADHWSIGADDGTHLEIGTFSLGFELADPMRFSFSIGDGALAIPKSAFGFMGSLMPEAGVKFTFDVDLSVDTKGKLSFAGGAGMTVTLPVNRSLLILRVRAITLGFALDGGNDKLQVSLAATVAFGLDFGSVFKVDVDNIGAKLAWMLPSSPQPPDGSVPIVHGNLGPAGDLGLDFVPPLGIGVIINAGPIKGGGFFYLDVPHRTYAGVVEASLALCGKGIQIKAAGLLRETDTGWDFVLILSAQFEPAIEIFLGLTLNGVGGMFGLNVGFDVNKLRASLHDGSVSRLLFPDDPVANAPAIIATMIAVFPHRQGGIVVGPMLQLGWGRPKSFVRLSVAVVITLPSPAQLVLLGSLRVAVPDPALPLVDIAADFLGVIDLEAPSFAFDASLVHSGISMFPITGDMMMRAGAQGFILSIGGFNPRFTPPADVGSLKRIAIDISANPITRIHAEAYLAITSNTFQIGLHAALDIDAGVASVHGWLDFDALIRWEPRFWFSIHMDAGLELRVGGESIAGVSVDLLLEGPGPWHAKGSASLHILFFTVHAGFEVSWGESDAATQPPEIDASAHVVEALQEQGAWTAIAPDGDAWITFRATERDAISVHPYGQLSVRQQAVPIGIPITRIGQSHVAGGTATVTLTPIAGAPEPAPTMGQFASAQFSDLTDDQKLSRPSFETYQDGVSFGSTQTVLSDACAVTASYETVMIPARTRIRLPLDTRLLTHALDHGAVARAGLHFATLHDGPNQPVRVAPARYRVVAADSLTAATPTAAASSAEAFAVAATLAPKARVLVVDAHEMVS